MFKLILATLGLFVLAHTMTWAQMNLQFKYIWLRENLWVPLLFAIPIGYLFMKGVQNIYDYYGEVWPAKIIGFCIGNVVFGVLTYFFLDEGINMKTAICLGLSFIIVIIQVFWK